LNSNGKLFWCIGPIRRNLGRLRPAVEMKADTETKEQLLCGVAVQHTFAKRLGRWYFKTQVSKQQDRRSIPFLFLKRYPFQSFSPTFRSRVRNEWRCLPAAMQRQGEHDCLILDMKTFRPDLIFRGPNDHHSSHTTNIS
jgi:hypothetical protein